MIRVQHLLVPKVLPANNVFADQMMINKKQKWKRKRSQKCQKCVSEAGSPECQNSSYEETAILASIHPQNNPFLKNIMIWECWFQMEA